MLRFISVFEPCDLSFDAWEAQRVRWGRRACVMELRRDLSRGSSKSYRWQRLSFSRISDKRIH